MIRSVRHNPMPLLLLTGWLTLSPALAWCEANDTMPAPVHDTAPGSIIPLIENAMPAIMERADTTHTRLSNSLENLARRIDRFFSEDKAFDETTSTYARVRADNILREGMKLGYIGNARIKIDLPQTQRALKLVIESDIKGDTTQTPLETPVSVVQKQEYLLSVEHAPEQPEGWSIRPAMGIKLRWPPDPFARVRAIRYHKLDGWLARASGSASWFASSGYGADSAIEFDHPLSEALLFRSATSLSWSDENQFLSAFHQFSIYQRLDARSSLAYQTGVEGSQHPDWDARRFYLEAHYRNNIYQKWLFLELIPQLNFAESLRFHQDASFTLRLEAVFGREYL